MRQLKGLFASIFLVSSLVWTSPAFAADISRLPSGLRAKVDLAVKACTKFNDGQFDLDWGAVERVDLDGDLHHDWVLNESGFACSSAASLYCGTGGCMSHFWVSEEVHSLLNQGWKVVDFGDQRVVVADIHGSNCGGINPTPCVTASVWDAEANTWRSSAGNWEQASIGVSLSPVFRPQAPTFNHTGVFHRYATQPRKRTFMHPAANDCNEPQADGYKKRIPSSVVLKLCQWSRLYRNRT
ncbi:hypothetical protein [Ruegeria arenilitoris]|uniref:hypothetical protein n=1 Tax=Ruegeria arenilitoris TaxID=1173585 RepID=UPI0015809E19|nr:hypothetical protein [Ruegeria arenilitoris]